MTEIIIDRPRAEVAGYASNPENATDWYANIVAVEWRTPQPLGVGSKVAFVARFLGRRLEYTYQVRELIPNRKLVMSTADGPFAMETTYKWEDAPGGGTRMTLRNRGVPSGFTHIAAPIIANAMRRTNGKDLIRIKAILESPTPST